MKQLGGMDTNFLNMESPTTYGHVSSLTIFEPKPGSNGAGLEITKRTILARIDRLEPYRRRLVTVPLGLDNPYWIDDPNFDIDYHVRHHAVPPPGTPQQLAEVVSRIISRPLDRTRPLWELYVIEGVEGGRYIAQLNKIHHATIDGAAGVLMLGVMLDQHPGSEPNEPVAAWPVDEIPSSWDLLRRTAVAFVQRPEKMVRLSIRAGRAMAARSGNLGLMAMAEAAARPLPGPLGRAIRDRIRGERSVEDELPQLPRLSAPRTPFNATISPHRRFAYTTIPLEDARDIRRAFGVTFNDVVMALCAGTLRRYLQAHDALPEQPLVAMVPISVRPPGDTDDVYRNKVSGLTCELATDEADPVARLHRIAARMAAAKERFDPVSAEALQDFTQFAPPAVAGQAMRLISRLRIADRVGIPVNVVISNVPGPNHPLYSAGAELKHFYPVSTISDGIGLNLTVQSYHGSLDFGFVADRELVPDLWSMIDLLHESMAELHGAAQAAMAPAEPAARAGKRPVRRTRTR